MTIFLLCLFWESVLVVHLRDVYVAAAAIDIRPTMSVLSAVETRHLKAPLGSRLAVSDGRRLSARAVGCPRGFERMRAHAFDEHGSDSSTGVRPLVVPPDRMLRLLSVHSPLH